MTQEPNETDILLGVFLEEATDLLDAMSVLMQQWVVDLKNTSLLVDLKRHLHTFKGGARMMNQGSLSTLAHQSESLCDSIIAPNTQAQKKDYDLLFAVQDRMHAIVECLKHQSTLPGIDDLGRAILAH